MTVNDYGYGWIMKTGLSTRIPIYPDWYYLRRAAKGAGDAKPVAADPQAAEAPQPAEQAQPSEPASARGADA